jgi:predicted AlkP superfamily phosphohydrolase/phosphomutase
MINNCFTDRKGKVIGIIKAVKSKTPKKIRVWKQKGEKGQAYVVLVMSLPNVFINAKSAK